MSFRIHRSITQSQVHTNTELHSPRLIQDVAQRSESTDSAGSYEIAASCHVPVNFDLFALLSNILPVKLLPQLT